MRIRADGNRWVKVSQRVWVSTSPQKRNCPRQGRSAWEKRSDWTHNSAKEGVETHRVSFDRFRAAKHYCKFAAMAWSMVNRVIPRQMPA